MIRSRRRCEDGAVAIIVAMTVSFVLIPVAAMAVDLGVVYVREADLARVADQAARAGATELAVAQRVDGELEAAQVMAAARSEAAQALCVDVLGDPGWQDACAGAPTWAGDGDPANGEVSFYTGAPLSDGGYAPEQAASDAVPDDRITGIRVVTPPLRVQYGLAAAFTTDHVDLQGLATAGLFTVLPRNGFLPMFLRPGEVGGFCTRSAPRSIWHPTQPNGCTVVARGNLAADRTDPTENAAAMAWNAAVGFDRDHLPLPAGGTATFQAQGPSPTSSLVRELSPGLFGGTGSGGAPARLKNGQCPGGYSSTSGPHSSLESAHLADFADPRIGDKYAFRSLALAGSVPPESQRGWLDAGILRCGRLAVVPVLDGVPPLPYDGLTQLTYSVTDLRLIWLDSRMWGPDPDDEPVATGACLHRGFFWAHPNYASYCDNALRAYTGYILDPRLLPATVDGAGANALDRYIGHGLPATVRLVRDVTDPPAR